MKLYEKSIKQKLSFYLVRNKCNIKDFKNRFKKLMLI